MTFSLHHHVCESPAEWRSYGERAAAMSFAQSWTYARTLASDQGAESEQVVTTLDGVPVAMAAVRVKRVPGLPFSVSYVSRGPVMLDDAPEAVTYNDVVESLAAWCLSKRSGSVRIAPPVLAEPPAVWPPKGPGWELSDKSYFTIVLDLAAGLEATRKAFKQKWRNQLNASERKELEILVDEGPGGVERFAPLYEAIVSRKGFDSELGPEFYTRVQRAADGNDPLTCLFATHEGRDVAGIVVWMRGGTATYILGASTKAAMQLKASYLLQWTAIERAHELGCRYYDLGGIDPEANPGVYHFKSGMGGEEVRSLPMIERASSRAVGVGLRSLEKLYRLKNRPRAERPAAEGASS